MKNLIILFSVLTIIFTGCSSENSSVSKPNDTPDQEKVVQSDDDTRDSIKTKTEPAASNFTETEPTLKEIPSVDNPKPEPQKTQPTKLKPAEPAFFTAAFEGDIDTIKAAINEGVDVNSIDENEKTALMLAAFNGHTQITELLIDSGAKVNALDPTGRTALMYAATGPNLSTVQLLVARDAKVNLIDNKEAWTALMFAVAEGQLEIVKFLLKNGANWKLKDADGDTARDFAANANHTEVVKRLDAQK